MGFSWENNGGVQMEMVDGASVIQRLLRSQHQRHRVANDVRRNCFYPPPKLLARLELILIEFLSGVVKKPQSNSVFLGESY